MRIEGSLFLLFLCLCACVACYVLKFKVERSYHMNDFLLCNLVHESFREGSELSYVFKDTNKNKVNRLYLV